MSLSEPYPSLEELIASMGAAGRRIADMAASEGAAGNISICIGWPIEVRRRFPVAEEMRLPSAVPALAGRTLLITGSGRRLRDIHTDPEANLGAVTFDASGTTGTVWTSTRRLFLRLTSELNSHLSVHADRAEQTDEPFSAVIHAQPLHLTLLSHIPEYRAGSHMSRRLVRWEPETIVNLPHGLCVLPFLLPGSAQLEEATVAGLRNHEIVVWSKHGVMARSDRSATHATDLIEYAETAARYELLDRSSGGTAEGLTDEELRAIVEEFKVDTTLL